MARLLQLDVARVLSGPGGFMDFVSHLRSRREAALTRWRELIVGTYPREAGKFLFGQKDAFANPVGYTIEATVAKLYDGLLDGKPAGDQRDSLDEIIRIRAVQDFSPSDGLRFVFLLKTVLREQVTDQMAATEIWPQLSRLEAAVDELAMEAFDSYTACRERLANIRHSSLQRRTHHLLELAHWQEKRKKARETQAPPSSNGGETR
jgi:hypothetical protein